MSGVGLTQGAAPSADAPAGSAAGGPGAEAPVETGGGGGAGDVGIVLSGSIGLGLAVAFLAALFPFRTTYVGQLFFARGGVPYVLAWQFGWSVAILFLKYRNVKRQKQAMILDLLPGEISENITTSSLDKFVNHIHSLPVKASKSMLITRLQRSIEHFRVRQSAGDTYSMMSSQSEIDANTIAGSYALLKYFIWAIPIMGFIGTVIGISGGVGELSKGFAGAADTAELKASLGGLMTNLATAFDTTLVALVMSILVKLPTDAMRKTEDGLVTWVDEYCNENFLRRLDDGSEGAASRNKGSGMDPEVFQKVVQSNLAQQQKQFEAWLGKVDGSELTKQSADAWQKVSAGIAEQQSK